MFFLKLSNHLNENSSIFLIKSNENLKGHLNYALYDPLNALYWSLWKLIIWWFQRGFRHRRRQRENNKYRLFVQN